MEFEPYLKIPKQIPLRPDRTPQKNIPDNKPDRDRIKKLTADYVAKHKLTPPLPFDDLKKHGEGLLADAGLPSIYLEYVAILLNNETWREIVAGIPYNRRLLLLPVCLRDEAQCTAPFDEFGLLCKKCGMCSIQHLQEEAEKLGYATLVAEGTPIVLSLIETGQIEAVVGVSCLNVLERVYPYMESVAAPGMAIPLLQDDCADTNIDIDWLWDVIHLTSDDRTYRMNLDEMRKHVAEWFEYETMCETIGGEPPDETGKIAWRWMAKDGKRWRPFLTSCMFHAVNGSNEFSASDDLKKLAIAVECFHKASLIHDDIEDNDKLRYGEETMHETYGVPVALNVGDYLLGEGYRLIAETGGDAEVRAEMLRTAALGHRMLSVGQGDELLWTRNPAPMKSRTALNIFRHKTAPAFEVALRIGAQFAGSDEKMLEIVHRYSESLGIAYQIADDLDDIFGDTSDSNDAMDMRPSVLLAMAWERAVGEQKELMKNLWEQKVDYETVEAEVKKIILELGIEERAQNLLEGYKEEAVRALYDLENPTVKGLLRRVLGKIFDDSEMDTFCHEFRAGNAPSGQVVTEVSG